MKVYIVCDLEGVAGVVDFEKQCDEKGAYYQQAIRVATLELNALVEGLLEGGVDEIYAWPGHCDFPGGIDFELIHPECKLVMNAGDGGPAGVDGTFDAMILHGFHAMAGTPLGVLSHSFYPLLKNVWFGEEKVGEIAMNMYSFAEYRVPTIMITGDQAAVEEAQKMVPDIVGVPVKWGLGEKMKLGALSVCRALSLSPEKSRVKIREAARRAVSRVDEFKPVKLKKPFTLKVEYIKPEYANGKMGINGVNRVDACTIDKICDSLEDVIF
jgi:D-amino peptidase